MTLKLNKGLTVNPHEHFSSNGLKIQRWCQIQNWRKYKIFLKCTVVTLLHLFTFRPADERINFKVKRVAVYCIIYGQRIYQKAFLNWFSINSFCQYLSFLNIFFNRFSPVETCRITQHCLCRDSLTLAVLFYKLPSTKFTNSLVAAYFFKLKQNTRSLFLQLSRNKKLINHKMCNQIVSIYWHLLQSSLSKRSLNYNSFYMGNINMLDKFTWYDLRASVEASLGNSRLL